MATLEPNVNEIRHLHKRVVAVISSCLTLDQLEVAENYMNLAIKIWEQKYPKGSVMAIRHRNFIDNTIHHLEDLFKLKRKSVKFNRF